MKQLATQTMLTPIGAELAEARGGVPRIRPDVKVAARIKYMLGVRVAATAAGVLHVLHDSHELVDLERSVAEVVEVALQHVRHLLHPPEVVQRLRSRLHAHNPTPVSAAAARSERVSQTQTWSAGFGPASGLRGKFAWSRWMSG